LTHPGVIKMFDTFSDGEHIYLVLEFCEMGEFTNLLKGEKGT
jgi:serine/threonine protein kinase